MPKKEYKNAIESKKKLIRAYLELLSQGNTKISVMDIVRESGLNRGTFYLHFKNINELSLAIDSNLAENFKVLEKEFRQVDIDNLPTVIIEKFNEILMKDIKYYKLIINACEHSKIMDKIKKSIVTLIYNNFKLMKYITSLDRFKTVLHYIVGGVFAVYIEWFKGEITGELSTLSEYLSTLISAGLKGYIKT